jgi:HEPN domain-containing protein
MSNNEINSHSGKRRGIVRDMTEIKKHYVKTMYADGVERWTAILLTDEQAKELIKKDKKNDELEI